MKLSPDNKFLLLFIGFLRYKITKMEVKMPVKLGDTDQKKIKIKVSVFFGMLAGKMFGRRANVVGEEIIGDMPIVPEEVCGQKSRSSGFQFDPVGRFK